MLDLEAENPSLNPPFNDSDWGGDKLRDRRRHTLFIDAQALGTMQSRTLRVLADDDIAKIADTYHAWREKGDRYRDEPGFAKSATTDEIAVQG